MNTKGKFYLGLAIVLGTILVIGFVFLNPLAKKQTPQSTDSTTEKQSPHPTESLYDSFDIPTTQISYPNGWPQDLHYPQQLELVHAQGNTEVGWEAALTYSGTAKEASDILESFFVSKGWKVTDRTIVDENNLGFFIGRDDKQGVIIIGSDPSTNTVKIVLTVDE